MSVLAACRPPSGRGKLPPGLVRRLSAPRAKRRGLALVDLYDFVRITGQGRRALMDRLGLPAHAGLRSAARALVRRFGPHHPASRLLAWDLEAPRRDGEVLRLRRLLLARGPVRANAGLRAASLCLQSFWTALARPWERAEALGWCHLVLVGSRGRVLAGRALGVLELAARTAELLRGLRRPGLRQAATRLLSHLGPVQRAIEASIPDGRGLPRSGWISRWSGSQVVRFSQGRLSWRGGTSSLAVAELRPALTELLAASPLRHLLLSVPGQTSFGQLLPVVRAAVLTGFESLGLGARSPRNVFGEVRVSLLPLASWPRGPKLPGTSCPPRRPLVSWPETCYRKGVSVGLFPDGLVLQVGDRCWGLRSPSLGPNGSRTTPVALLRLVRREAPGDCSVAVYVHPDVHVAGLVSLLAFLKGQRPDLHLGLRLDWPSCGSDSSDPENEARPPGQVRFKAPPPGPAPPRRRLQ